MKFLFSELFLCCIVSAFDSPTIIKKAPKILEMVHSYADKMGKYIIISLQLHGIFPKINIYLHAFIVRPFDWVGNKGEILVNH